MKEIYTISSFFILDEGSSTSEDPPALGPVAIEQHVHDVVRAETGRAQHTKTIHSCV